MVSNFRLSKEILDNELIVKLNSLDERVCRIIGDAEVNACYIDLTPTKTGREIEIYPVKGSIQEIHFWKRSGGPHPVIEYAGPQGMQVYLNGQGYHILYEPRK